MALREVLQFPDKRLRRVSKPITAISDEIRSLAADMLEVMYDEPGIGLAAPQVGEAVRLVVVDTEWREENAERSPLVLVNPEIVVAEGSIVWTEGCLSVPDFEAEVERFARVTLRALDLEGREVVDVCGARQAGINL
jgi:peptide deformylase